MRRRFRQVDVFSHAPYRGNPVAVVLDADGLSDEEMARFASWTNLSETTFVLPPNTPDADYRVRIFTPSDELPFAGHPTLGTCRAWLDAGGAVEGERPVVQECGAGLVTVARTGDRLAFAAPPLVRAGDVDEADVVRIAAGLRIDRSDIVAAQWVDNGPGWVAVLLRDVDAVLALRPAPLDDLYVGAVAAFPPGGPADVEVRAFFPVNGATAEDPVTGSLNASLAPWLTRTGVVSLPYVARQGTVLGRDGRVFLDSDPGGDPDGTIWVAGSATVCVSGEVDL